MLLYYQIYVVSVFSIHLNILLYFIELIMKALKITEAY